MSIIKRIVAGEKVAGIDSTPKYTTREDEARCAGCGAPVKWRYTPGNKLMPLDAEPVAVPSVGCFVITSSTNCRRWEPLFDSASEVVAYMPHWATCPKADQFKR